MDDPFSGHSFNTPGPHDHATGSSAALRLSSTPLARSRQTASRQGGQHSSSLSRSGSPAVMDLPYGPPPEDSKAIWIGYGLNVQPSMKAVLQPKHRRPVSREVGTSAWAAAPHKVLEQHVYSRPLASGQASSDRPLNHAAMCRPSDQQILRQYSSPQAVTHLQRPASVQRKQSARPASKQQRSPFAESHATCASLDHHNTCLPSCFG